MIVHDSTCESLSQRLAALPTAVPPTLVADALARSHEHDVRAHRRGRRRVLIPAIVALVVALNAVAIYYVPAYAGTIAHIPGLGRFLQTVGLTGADLTSLDVAAEHDGVRLHVSAGYADENHTVLFLDLTRPPGAGNFEQMRLTDQFGHTYAARASGWGAKLQRPDPGQVAGEAVFDPISGAAATLGARLTLTASHFDRSVDQRTGQVVQLPGTWSVTFVLEQHAARHVSVAPGHVAGADYTFWHVTLTPGVAPSQRTLLDVGWRVQGPAVQAANAAEQAFYEAHLHDRAAGPPPDSGIAFAPLLFDAQGRRVPLLPFLGFTAAASQDNAWGEYDYAVDPGVYTLVGTGTDGSTMRRSITVP